MAYSKERANNVSKNDIKYLPAGVITDVTLKEARTDVSPTGNRFFEIVFEKDGATLTHTEWEPKLGGFTTTAEQLQQKEDNQYSRMLQILHCFYDDALLNFNGENFEQFANWIVMMLNAADKSKKLRVKIVYNDKGYTTLPSYAKYTFIEPMTLPEGESSAIAELGIDKFVRPVKADAETPVTNPLEAGAALTSNPTNDLPF
jgi:hypothetical protein